MTTRNPTPNIPNAPSVPGLTFRHYQGESDIAVMLAVHEGCRKADQIDPFSVCYRIPNLPPDEYAKDVAGSLAEGFGDNVLLTEVEGRVIAHSRLEWWNERDEQSGLEKRAYLSRGWVLPEWRGKGIGTALLHWAEGRARDLDRGQNAPGELAANASDGEQDAIALLRNEGYELRFLSPELGRDLADLPVPATPPGFEVRPLENEHWGAVARAIIEANADPNATPSQLADWIAREEPQWTESVAGCDPTISRIGWINGEVAGLHVCRRVGSGVGDVANVAVRPAYRRRGLARALMFHCLHAMREQGLQSARLYTGIGTDRDAAPSGPLAMYQGFGFRLLAFHNRYRKPLPS